MVNITSDTRGTLPGGPIQGFRREPDGRLHPQPSCAGVELAPGQTLSVSSGDGGYGSPWQRDPERGAHDVREGCVSRAWARGLYVVEVDERGRWGGGDQEGEGGDRLTRGVAHAASKVGMSGAR